MRGADVLVKTLAAAGVKKIFSLSGNQIMPLYDACIDHQIEIVHVRHEAAAVFMADAWSQLTAEIGIALVTAAPGLTNALAPLYTARQSESAVLLLSGDSPLAQDGKGAFQELDQISVTQPLTKMSIRASSASALAHEIARGIQTALSGRPGPVHIALPFDVLEANVEHYEPVANDAYSAIRLKVEDADANALRAAIAKASKPLVLCGPSLNATRFGSQLSRLADLLDAPLIPMESPRGLKDPSLGELATAMSETDLVVCLGKPVDFTLGFGQSTKPHCRWYVIDAEEAALERGRTNLGKKLVKAIHADPRVMADALERASRQPEQEPRSEWLKRVLDLTTARSFKSSTAAASDKISPLDLCEAVQRQIARTQHSVVICDGGEFGQWAQAVTSGEARLINGTAGAIGGGLCYAVAAKIARPNSVVFALMGDGTIGFHLAEFETAARENTAFVVVVGNDQRWNAERVIQLREYGAQRLIGCDLSSARYDLAVEGLGGHGEYVTDIADLDAALERAVKSGKVACVNVCIDGKPAPTAAGH